MGTREIYCPLHGWQPVDRHHVKPKFYGGARDGHTELICHECHINIHREHEDMKREGWLGLCKKLREEGVDPSEHMSNLAKKRIELEREALGEEGYKSLQRERAASRWRDEKRNARGSETPEPDP